MTCQCPACKITPHASDCAVHNEPAYPAGPCNCPTFGYVRVEGPIVTVTLTEGPARGKE